MRPIYQVKTSYGVVEGVPSGDPSVRVFRGMPYAAAPVGPRRWRAPERPESWDGVRDASRFAPGCPQARNSGVLRREVFREGIEFSEDCLYINVWAPAASPEDRLPVLFWIHGGANVAGYGHEAPFDGDALARRGIILVTFNWRVNIFGWLAHGDLTAEQGSSGNYALQDQIAALEWVKENIAGFGGDPDAITIAGESAGASSVQLLSMTPRTSGWFRSAIMQSGGGVDLFASGTVVSRDIAEERTDLRLALGVDTIDDARSLTAGEIVRRLGGGYSPMPVDDGDVLPGTMVQLAREGRYHDVDYMIGYTADETGMYEFPADKAVFLAAQRKEYGPEADDYLALCDFLDDDEAFLAHLRTRSAEMLKTGAIGWAQLLERHGRRPAHVYRFSRQLPGDDLGAYHSSELWYLFGTLDRNWRPFTGADHELSALMTDYWADFVSTGDPNGARRPFWTPFTQSTPLTYDFDLVPGLRHLPLNARERFRHDFVLGR